MACIFHGSHGMNLIGSLQIAASIGTCRMQELVFTTPPVLPDEAWSPLNVLVNDRQLYTVKNGLGRCRGPVSEVRVSACARSPDYMRAQYANLSDPESFVSPAPLRDRP